jgi:hypothetical protein
MSRVTGADLYRRLPAHTREVDDRHGGAVRAVLEIVAEQADRIGAQIDELADSWFVETCPDWAVPYLADLLGVALTHDITVDDDSTAIVSQRAHVANTIRYRRRKGTASVLESLAFDVGGWRAVAVEEFERLVTTQHLIHPRTHLPNTVDLRAGANLEATPGPFGVHAHTVDVRNVALDRGLGAPRPNTSNVTLHSYRVDGLLVPTATARPAGAPGRYRIDPLDRDVPLVNPPVHDAGVDVRATEDEVPAPLRRRRLREELDARRAAIAAGAPDPAPRWTSRPPFRLFVVPAPGAVPAPVPAEQVEVCRLDPWKPASPSGRIRVDPVAGRIVAPDPQPQQLLVTAAPGGVPGVGAGPAARSATRDELGAAGVTWQRGVSRDVAPVAGEIAATLDAAVAAWNATPAGTVGVIALMDNDRHDVDLTGPNRIRIREGSRLTIVAAGWPELSILGGPPGRVPGVVTPERSRPAVVGDIDVRGDAPASSQDPGELLLDGLLMSGTLQVTGTVAQQLGRLRVRSCTQVTGGITATGNRSLLSVEIVRSHVGPVTLPASVSGLEITASVVDGGAGAGGAGGGGGGGSGGSGGGAGAAIDAEGAAADLDRVTALGTVAVKQLEASECLFVAPVDSRIRQQGCVRYSYVAPGSTTPRRYRCIESPTPAFVSTVRGDRNYALLAASAGVELRTANERGDEVGAYAVTRTTQREQNTAIALSEYVRIGIAAGIVRVLSSP